LATLTTSIPQRKSVPTERPRWPSRPWRDR
jgi:hypothetical protein